MTERYNNHQYRYPLKRAHTEEDAVLTKKGEKIREMIEKTGLPLVLSRVNITERGNWLTFFLPEAKKEGFDAMVLETLTTLNNPGAPRPDKGTYYRIEPQDVDGIETALRSYYLKIMQKKLTDNHVPETTVSSVMPDNDLALKLWPKQEDGSINYGLASANIKAALKAISQQTNPGPNNTIPLLFYYEPRRALSKNRNASEVQFMVALPPELRNVFEDMPRVGSLYDVDLQSRGEMVVKAVMDYVENQPQLAMGIVNGLKSQEIGG